MVDDVEKVVVKDKVVELKDILIQRGEPLSKWRRPLKNTKSVIEALELVFDPEMNIDIYNLGLIYDIKLNKNGDVDIVMTLTSPTCPMADEIPVWVAETVASLERVGVVNVKVVWSPVWDLSKMSEEAKFQMEISDMHFPFSSMDFD